MSILKMILATILTCLMIACKKNDKVSSSLSVDKTSLHVEASTGKDYLQLTANTAWSINGLPEWLVATPGNGSGNAKIELAYTTNAGATDRTATFEVKGATNDIIPIKITFTQAGSDLIISSFTEHAKGGDVITITGVGFSNNKDKIKVTINDNPATITQASPTSLSVSVPAGAGDGVISVEVEGKKNTSTQKFIYDWVGVVTTVAGNGSSAVLSYPSGLVQGTDEAIYVSDRNNHRICRIEPRPTGNSEITTFAGSYQQSGNENSGTGTGARFTYPNDITIDGSGNFFVADGSFRVRKITQGGFVSTLSQNTGAPFSVQCLGIVAYGNGNLILPAYTNHTIYRLSSAGEFTSIPESSGNVQAFSNPRGAICSKDGKQIYIADASNNRIQQLIKNADGTYTRSIKAGSRDATAGSKDGNGPDATFYLPADLALDGQGNLYVADQYNHLIRKITTKTDGSVVVSTIAGSGDYGFKDGKGTTAQFQHPTSIIVNDAGTILYVADSGNNRIRKIVLQ